MLPNISGKYRQNKHLSTFKCLLTSILWIFSKYDAKDIVPLHSIIVDVDELHMFGFSNKFISTSQGKTDEVIANPGDHMYFGNRITHADLEQV